MREKSPSMSMKIAREWMYVACELRKRYRKKKKEKKKHQTKYNSNTKKGLSEKQRKIQESFDMMKKKKLWKR